MVSAGLFEAKKLVLGTSLLTFDAIEEAALVMNRGLLRPRRPTLAAAISFLLEREPAGRRAAATVT
jgi:hypothetical protein